MEKPRGPGDWWHRIFASLQEPGWEKPKPCIFSRWGGSCRRVLLGTSAGMVWKKFSFQINWIRVWPSYVSCRFETDVPSHLYCSRDLGQVWKFFRPCLGQSRVGRAAPKICIFSRVLRGWWCRQLQGNWAGDKKAKDIMKPQKNFSGHVKTWLSTHFHLCKTARFQLENSQKFSLLESPPRSPLWERDHCTVHCSAGSGFQ